METAIITPEIEQNTQIIPHGAFITTQLLSLSTNRAYCCFIHLIFQCPPFLGTLT